MQLFQNHNYSLNHVPTHISWSSKQIKVIIMAHLQHIENIFTCVYFIGQKIVVHSSAMAMFGLWFVTAY